MNISMSRPLYSVISSRVVVAGITSEYFYGEIASVISSCVVVAGIAVMRSLLPVLGVDASNP